MARPRSSSSSALRVLLPVAAGAAYYFFLRPQMLKAGTQLGESQRRLPGDEMIMTPNFQSTRAINIDAPPEAVWPWIAQMGREKTGFYGLDALTNQSIPSVAYLRQDLPAPQVGMDMDGGYRILEVDPEHLFLYGGFDLPTPMGSPMECTVLLRLERQRDGGTRLIRRQRGYTYGMLGPLYNALYEVIDYFDSMIQLENIRQRAETMAYLQKG